MSKFAKISLPILALITAIAVVFIWPKKATAPLNQNSKPIPVKTTLFFGGDIMLSRNVAARMYEANDYTLPYTNIKDETTKADIAFANLESPFNDRGDHSVEGSLIFNADPLFLPALVNAGFDILSTANNHTLDQGTAGLNYTYNNLKLNNVIPVGTMIDCHTGSIITKNNITFGFLAYSYTAYNDGGKIPDNRVCDANDLVQVAADIQALRSKVDQLYVSVHMGVEYTRTPNETGVKFAHTAIDSGADFIIGHHPHWIQTIEQYNGKWIFYSLGNFIFDQMFSQDTREGLAVKVFYDDKKMSKIELKPLIIENFCCPRWTNEEETKNILQKLNLTSTIL